MDPVPPIRLFDASGSYFESLAQERGAYWFARDLMTALGYGDWNAFKDIIDKAMAVYVSRTPPDYTPVTRNVNGEEMEDFRLTRFACCMIALKADRQLPAVAIAQDYFAAEIRYEIEDFIEYR